MTPNLVQPNACDCAPILGALFFPAGAEGCKKPDEADQMIFRYDYLARDPANVDALSPEDLNNIACYLLWQASVSQGNVKTAHDLLQKALDKAKGKAKGKALKALLQEVLDKAKDEPLKALLQEALGKAEEKAGDEALMALLQEALGKTEDKPLKALVEEALGQVAHEALMKTIKANLAQFRPQQPEVPNEQRTRLGTAQIITLWEIDNWIKAEKKRRESSDEPGETVNTETAE